MNQLNEIMIEDIRLFMSDTNYLLDISILFNINKTFKNTLLKAD